ncbi:MAG TPA: DUF1080 domain-containing protein [Pirellulaceae bacterium]|jgi:hypothetical protein|nr:DUF1080 domain-containing protein [Pirellulaceae bacterium]
MSAFFPSPLRSPLGALLTLVLAAALVGCNQTPPLKPAPGPAPATKLPPGYAQAKATETLTADDAEESRTAAAASAEAGNAKEAGPKRFPAGPLTDPITLPDELLEEGWISLFDGETLFGWEANADCDWRVEGGAIVVSEGPVGLLCTTVPFADYELELEWKAPAETNAGVFLHVRDFRSNPESEAYEINIAPPDNPFPTGSIVQRKKADGPVDAPADQWNAYRILVEGARVAVYLNGNLASKYEAPEPLPPGSVCLQHNTGAVAYRNIRLKPLGMKPLLAGELDENWKTFDGPAKFEMTDAGELHVDGGKGRIESRESYGDFILQAEARTNAAALNSGIFFRCIPGEEMNGYESQIQNAVKEGDRSKPVDCGTGGIFRRVDARWVPSDDQEWLYKTIVADGPRVAVWVDGLQVTDWTDERAADPNPRKGLRTEPGTIQLQAHDPTTDLDFRDISVRSLD